MHPITPNQMDKIDANSEKLGIPRILLMENAGSVLADHIINHVKELDSRKVVVVAGTGNNGGDGFVAARHLAGYSKEISVILLGNKMKTKESTLNWNGIKNMYKTIKLLTTDEFDFEKKMKTIILEADIIIDAIFGTGIKGLPRKLHSNAINLINDSKAYILSVDVPSGLDPLTGEVNNISVIANETITFHRFKIGLLKRKDITGKIILKSIGVPPEAEEGVMN
ncbi:MAG TPA: NAD(P)H-hydrate epimerase [Nitrososphaerales archaeon]|jgi:NAD(P)H-hydrate epimerase|nr:NAD(P)H-hydrate epimerase [Nitrososphaerales archaeon]|tara:strand:- start:3949 stop:4620 length:672 start_codon:yes stop_codon:yes gene_type:complete